MGPTCKFDDPFGFQACLLQQLVPGDKEVELSGEVIGFRKPEGLGGAVGGAGFMWFMHGVCVCVVCGGGQGLRNPRTTKECACMREPMCVCPACGV